MRTLTRISLVSTLVLAGGLATASDLTAGGARAAGMGGAGLALKDEPSTAVRRNPAAAGLVRGFAFQFPRAGYRISGIGYSDLVDEIESVSNGGLDFDSLGRFARTFGDQSTEFGAHVDAYLIYDGFFLGYGLGAAVDTVPNAALQAWVQGGGDPLAFTGAEVLDGYGVGRQRLDVGYGQTLPTDDGLPTITVGARLSFDRGYFSHHVATGQDIDPNGGGGSNPAVEMNGANVFDESGVSLDLGAIVEDPLVDGLTYALVIDGFLPSGVNFDATRPNLNANRVGVDTFARRISVGAGYVGEAGTVVALDWFDLGNTTSQGDLRLGVEQAVGGGFALRAGYASNSGLTFGAGWNGIHIALGSELPFGLNSTFSF